MSDLKSKIDLLVDSAIRQIPKAKDLASLSKNLKAKSKVTKEFTEKAQRIINEHYAETGVNDSDKKEIKRLIKEACNKIMSA